tara:strand:- start:1039 stop:1335 length:297 start_codon:yes stop_codon:yes gene_type:complete
MDYKEWKDYIASQIEEPYSFYLIQGIKYRRDGIEYENNEPLLISINFKREYTNWQKADYTKSILRLYLASHSDWNELGAFLRKKKYEFTIIRPQIIKL